MKAGFILLIYICIGSGLEWNPQLGTVHNPRQVGRWPFARRGDVVKNGDNLYVAKQFSEIQSEMEPTSFEPLRKGSLRYPKSSGDEIEEVGEVFHDPSKNTYSKAQCVDKKDVCLKPISRNANWMSLLRDEIGDLPLGTIALPGSHDAATSGVDLDSYLVDTNFLFNLGGQVTPQVMVNWSRTQEGDLREQLEAGFRYFDLRIADMAAINETFFWWHGLTGDTIFEGLEQIATFAKTYPEEILILDFDHFAAMGDNESRINDIPEPRMDELADILLEYLSDVLVDQTLIPTTNPTMNQILATGQCLQFNSDAPSIMAMNSFSSKGEPYIMGRNAIALVSERYIRDKSPLFWNDILTYQYSGVSNTEDLFTSRSQSLIEFKQNSPDDITIVSGCVTPDVKIVVAGLVIEFGDDPLIGRIIDQLLPGVEVYPELMSFEGLWSSLVYMAHRGVNDLGMYSRNPASYSNGVSAHYHGTNAMYRYWLARPDKYKPSIVFNDDVTGSSNLVEIAIVYNMQELPREVSIAYQGTPTHGFYEWVNFTAIGGDEAYSCDFPPLSIQIMSGSYQLLSRNTFLAPFETVFQEGQYPVDSVVTVWVDTDGSLQELYSGNIQQMIESNSDLLVRGSSLGNSGLAYVYEEGMHPLFGDSCDSPPEGGYINIVQW